MKRHKHITSQKNQYWLLGLLVVVIIAGILIFSGGKDEAPEGELQIADQDQIELEQEVLDDAPAQEPTVEEIEEVIKEEAIEEAKEDAKEVNSKDDVGEDGLCEDYFFEQGDSLKINGHEIIVDRIGKGSLRLRVDGENSVIAEGDSEFLGDGIRVSIAPGDILYFSGDDADNAVQMRIGCFYDDNPNDKYIEQRGNKICKQVYEECQDSFGIELD